MKHKETRARSSRRVVRVDPDVISLVPGYLEKRRRDVTFLTEALQQEDYGTVSLLGYRMRGNGQTYGFSYLSELGAALEQAAKERDRSAIGALVQALETYLDELQVEPAGMEPQ